MKKLNMKMNKSLAITKIFCNTPNFFTIGPKTTTSNRVCPIYPDMRRVFSDPKALKKIARVIIQFMRDKNIKCDYVVGGATAGIGLAAAISLESGIPWGYVRKEPKGGGMGLAVEGNYRRGMTAVLVDDALGHGASKPIFVKNIRKAGLKINWVIVPVARTVTGKSGRQCMAWVKRSRVRFQCFSDIFDWAPYCVKNNIVTPEGMQLLLWYAEDAEHWHTDKKKWAFFQHYLKSQHESASGV
jgi:orotate phosphoribosyltransferase